MRYHYIDKNGIDVINEWIGGLQIRDQAFLKQKIDTIKNIGLFEASKLKLLAGPLKNKKREITAIYKIHVKGTVQLRPMMCKGPYANDSEFTILKDAIEKNNKLIPPSAVESAESRRSEILADSCRRIKIDD